MHPIRRHVGQRDQHEGAILHSGMGENQLVGGDAGLGFGGQVVPVTPRPAIGQHKVTYRQQIEIERALAPSFVPRAAMACLDVVKQGEKRVGRAVKLQACSGIYVVGPVTCGECRGSEKPADRGDLAASCFQIIDCQAQRIARRVISMRLIRAECEQAKLIAFIGHSMIIPMISCLQGIQDKLI